MTYTPDQHPRDLLPWLANGTLEEPERNAVEQHVSTCSDCQAELQLLQNLRTTMQAQAQPGAGELGLQRLLRSVRQRPAARPRWLLPVALAAGLVIALQAGLLIQMHTNETVYAPLSGPVAGAGVLQVQFAPDAREADLRALLRETGARIVDGPSAAGVYRIVVDPDKNLQSVTEALQARTDLIRYVAPEE